MSEAFERAVAAHRAGDLEEAARGYQAFADHPRALHNLGVVHGALGQFDEAESAFRRVLETWPDYASSRHSLAMQLLAQGRYAEAWPLYESRRHEPGSLIPNPVLGYPEWRGEDLSGKRLNVFGEQGFGDQLQFARFLPTLRRCAEDVIFVCSPSLVRLFEGAGLRVIAARRDAVIPAADYWCLLCSIPLHLGVTLETVPPPLRLGARTSGPPSAGRIGVAVRGRPTHLNDANRSLSADAANQLLSLGRNLDPTSTGAADFQDTAAIVETLDLVISVDTSIAHLAASLGVPTWILLPARGTDWRWLRGRDDSPWYPSVRLFRQIQSGDWASVLARVESALQAR